jgi:hypothetical protein
MELSLDTTHEAVDWVCTLLAEIKAIDDVRITQYADPNLSQPGERGVITTELDVYDSLLFKPRGMFAGNMWKKSLICCAPEPHRTRDGASDESGG